MSSIRTLARRCHMPADTGYTTLRLPACKEGELLPVISLRLERWMSRQCSLLDEKSEEVEIASHLASWSATITATRPEKATCIVANFFPEERWDTESER